MIDYKNELNKEQYKVVTTGDGPCLVLAGAGTGKTRTIIYRVAHLIEKGINPQKILLLTFTNKAAHEMMRRLDLLLGDVSKSFKGGTFHSTGNMILRKYAHILGYSRNFTILDQEDSCSLIKLATAALGVSKDKYFPKPKVINNYISFATNSGRSLRGVIQSKSEYELPVIESVKAIANKYKEMKKNRSLLDFDDLLFLWKELMLKYPEVAERLSNQYEYILIDEYQDTNVLQGQIVESLASHHNNVLVVGDDAQSIYAFRAATVENILRFPEIFKKSKTFRLEENYRSTPDILDLANESISFNDNQFEKNLKSSFDNIEKPKVVACDNSSQEAKFIADTIMEHLENGNELKDIVVLFRAAFHAVELELELQKRGVPYIIRGGIRFFEQAHIKDIVAYCKVLHNIHDDVAWQRILQLGQGIGPKTVSTIMNSISEFISFEELGQNLDKISLSYKANESFKLIVEELLMFNKELEKGISNVIKLIIKGKFKESLQSRFENAQDRLEDLNQLALFSERYEDMASFLADATLSEGFKAERFSDKPKNEDDVMVLSTIHQAKGLEWDSVIVMGLSYGQFPHSKSMYSSKELEEERRLFYVAITRAKKNLYLTFPMVSFLSTGMSMHRPSQFISELDSDLYESINLSHDSFNNDFSDDSDDDTVTYVTLDDHVV